MIESTKLILSNHWHKPGIKVSLLHDSRDLPQGGISLELPLEDFIQGLLTEVRHPVWMQTRGQLEDELRQGIHKTLEKVKQASTQAVL